MAFRPKNQTTTKAAEQVPEMGMPGMVPNTMKEDPIMQAPVAQPIMQQPVQQPVAPVPVVPTPPAIPVWGVQEIPTETQPFIYNSKTQETLDVMGALVRILNTFEELTEEE